MYVCMYVCMYVDEWDAALKVRVSNIGHRDIQEWRELLNRTRENASCKGVCIERVGFVLKGEGFFYVEEQEHAEILVNIM